MLGRHCARLRASLHIVIIADSLDVYDQLKLLFTGGRPLGRHKDMWDAALPCRNKVRDAIWIRAPSEAEEAMQRAEGGGYPMLHHDVNAGADTLVGWGKVCTPKPAAHGLHMPIYPIPLWVVYHSKFIVACRKTFAEQTPGRPPLG